jgi:hypothetical protein
MEGSRPVNMALDLVEHLALTALPMAAAALFSVRLGVRSVPILLAIGLAAGGAAAILSFWAFYADPLAGRSFSYLVLFGSALLAGLSLHEGDFEPGLLRGLATPLTLWALGSAFLVALGFVHGGVGNPLGEGATRFSGQLPSDNDIPRFFAEWFYFHGHHGTPPVYPGEWLASDRPPLQVGYVLLERVFGWDDTVALRYDVLGIVLQQLWIVGLWALLLAARVGRVTRALAMLTVLVSDVALVNGFFVWPKMLPTALLLGAAALVLTPLWPRLRRSLWSAALVAALLALAMLAHGASVFGAIALLLVAAFRGLPSWRWIAVAIAVGVALMAPWSAYQKYADPPGNRLTKWMLAGDMEIDDRGTSEAIVDAYREAGVGGTLHDKAENFVTMAGGGPAVELLERAWGSATSGDLAQAIREVRELLFFDLLPSLGLLLAVPFAMAVWWRRGRLNPVEWRFALTCFATLAAGALAWGLLLFGNLPARTILHAGSFLLPVLGLCGAVAGLRAVFPRFAIYCVSVSAALMLAIYVPVLDPLPGTAFSLVAALIAAAGLLGFGTVALRADGVAPPRPPPPSPESRTRLGRSQAVAGDL